MTIHKKTGNMFYTKILDISNVSYVMGDDAVWYVYKGEIDYLVVSGTVQGEFIKEFLLELIS